MKPKKILVLASLAIGSVVLSASAALAQQKNPVERPEAILAINEGVTYSDAGSASERYKPLLEILSKELERPVRVKSIPRYSDFDRDLEEGKYELVFIHPAHIGLKAVQRGSYYGLATAKGFTDYRARVLVAKDSPLQSMDQLIGKKIGVPSLESITTTLLVAHLNDLNFSNPEKFFHVTRYQDAVPFMIEEKFVDAGVTGSSAVAKAWTEKGGRILGETKPVPIKQFLVSNKIDASVRSRIQMRLLSLTETQEGKAALGKIGIPGFVLWDDKVTKEATRLRGL